MTELNTDIRKTINGWKAETTLPLGFEVEGKPAELRVSTYKDSSKPVIVTYAGVQTRDGGFTTTRVFRDFHERTNWVQRKATEKAVREEHEAVLNGLGTLKERALAHHRSLGDVA